MAEKAPSSSSSVFPAMDSPQRQSSSGNATGSLRNKVALPKGRSLMDWIRLGNSGVDLTSVGGRLLRISPEELIKHNTREDCWMAIGGIVYNITQYMEFHPGGVAEIMKAAGKDGTQLFNEVHRWVNYESMLRKCIVGKLVTESIFHRAPQYGNSLAPPRAMGTNLDTSNKPKKTTPTPSDSVDSRGQLPFAKPPNPDKPRYDYFQNDTHIKLSVYTRTPGVTADNMIIERPNSTDVRISLYLPSSQIYTLHFTPSHSLSSEYRIKSASGIGKVEVDFEKSEKSVKWTRLGEFLSEHNALQENSTATSHSINCTITHIERITHNTNLYIVSLPEGYHMIIPVCHHVNITAQILGTEISRSYTPVCRLNSQTKPSTRSLEFIIKIYPDGTLTQFIKPLKVADSITISHHIGSFTLSQLHTYNHVLLLAAGTGFTPITKLISHCINSTKYVHLVFFNKSQNDIIWREELDELTHNSNQLFKVTHVLSQAEPGWEGLAGRISDTMLANFLPTERKSQTYIAACGPIPFIRLTERLLKDLNVTDKQVHYLTG